MRSGIFSSTRRSIFHDWLIAGHLPGVHNATSLGCKTSSKAFPRPVPRYPNLHRACAISILVVSHELIFNDF